MTTTDTIKRTVLVIDDEDPLRSAICEYLTHSGYDVVDSSSGPDAIVKVTQENFDAIISDVRMPEMSGFDLMHVFDKLCENTIVILLTAVPDPDGNLAALAKEAGCFAYLNKPCKLHVLKDTLENAFTEYNSEAISAFASVEETPTETPSATTQPDSTSSPEPSTHCDQPISHEPVSESLHSSDEISEVEAIIRDPNQLPQDSDEEIAIKLETFSHHYGDLHMNAKSEIKREIEDILLRPTKDIRAITPIEYVSLSNQNMVQQGWSNQIAPLKDSNSETIPFDLIKNGIALKFGFQSTTLRLDLMNFQKAYQSENHLFDVAVLIIQTGNSQKYLKKTTGKSWSGASFNEAVRTLKSLQRNLDVPICILGLDVTGSTGKYEIDLASYARNTDPAPMNSDGVISPSILGEMSALQIKDCVFNYLQTRYGRAIDRNLTIKSPLGIMGVDGLMMLSHDVLLEIEMSKGQNIPLAKYLTSINEEDIAKPLRDYQRFTGRKAVMRFILLGGFTASYLRDLNWIINNACKLDDRLKIDFEVLSFDEIGIQAGNEMKSAHTGK